MTVATLNHTQVRTATVPPNPAATPYLVTDTINSFTIFPDGAVFVFKVADGLFDHVATVLDMQTYHDNLIDAQAANHPYYRLVTVAKYFTTMQLAIDFGDTTISRMTSLCNEYTTVTTSFETTITGTLP